MINYEDVKRRIIELIVSRGDEVTRQFLGDPGAVSWQEDKGLPNILLGLIEKINEQLEYQIVLKNKINEIIRRWNEQGFPHIDELP